LARYPSKNRDEAEASSALLKLYLVGSFDPEMVQYNDWFVACKRFWVDSSDPVSESKLMLQEGWDAAAHYFFDRMKDERMKEWFSERKKMLWAVQAWFFSFEQLGLK